MDSYSKQQTPVARGKFKIVEPVHLFLIYTLLMKIKGGTPVLMERSLKPVMVEIPGLNRKF
ncbi:MAG: hypothetical protein P8X47_12910 [Ignavibacteriaceae bacterium]